MANKRKGHKVGSSWYAIRKVGGRRRRVKVTKVGRKKYKVKVVKKR